MPRADDRPPTGAPTLVRICMRIVDLAALVVPGRHRRDWRAEWHGELWHRSSPVVPHNPRHRLVLRTLGSVRHALWLRSQDWSVDMLTQDLRFALRTLGRAPSFTAVAIAVLAIGIGANSLVFGMINAVLLRPFPWPEPQELVSVRGVDPERPGDLYNLSYPDFVDLRSGATTLEEVGMLDWEPANVRAGDQTFFAGAGQISPSYFTTLGVEPIVGRRFTEEEGAPGNDGVIVLGEEIWRSAFGADPGVLGQSVVVDGRLRRIVGVMPETAAHVESIDVWIPLALDYGTSHRGQRWLIVVGRLADDATRARATDEVREIGNRIAEAYPETSAERSFTLVPLRQQLTGDVRPFFAVMAVAVGFLLLIVCANLANLQLARSAVRRREISVRVALGAGRTRILRQLLTESVLIAAGGAVGGLLVSQWATGLMMRSIPEELPPWMTIGTEPVHILFVAGVALGAAMLFGLAPALRASRPDLGASLQDDAGRGTVDPRKQRLRKALVVAEVALSVTLVVGAGLMARSFFELSSVDPGFETDNRLLATMQLAPGSHDDASRVSFVREATARLGALPGVESVGVVSRFPLRGSSNRYWIEAEGQTEEQARDNGSVLTNSINPDYFRTMGIELLTGRSFRDPDDADGAPVVVINDTLATRLFPDGALGRRVRLGPMDEWREVVGVVTSVRHYTLENRPTTQAYLPYRQEPTGRLSIVLRTSVEPASLAGGLRRVIREVDPNQAVYDLMPVEDAVRRSIWSPRLFTQLAWTFALIAALIATLGIYGVISYAVAQRTHEVGVRMALGARSREILALMMRSGGTLVGAGVTLGLVGAWLLGRGLEAILFEVSGNDPLTFAATCALVAGVGLVATWLPARRATRLDPVSALRES